jgi:hypothetical protein
MAESDDDDDEEIYKVLNPRICRLVSHAFFHSSTKMFIIEQL